MGVPTKFYTFVDSQADVGKITAARLNGDFDPLYACLDPATGGLEDTNVKSGAKIVCTDRAHTVTGVWTFTTAPVFGAAAIPNAALQSSVMLKTTYDTDADGTVEAADDADTVDGQHASEFADVAHNHNLADLTEKSYNSLTDKPANTYSITAVALNLSTLIDEAVYYFGGTAVAPDAYSDRKRLYIPAAGTIRAAYVFWRAGTAGSGEDVSVSIRLNNTTDTLIATIGSTADTKVFSKTDLSIAVVQGDYIEIKIVCPVWATNPANVSLGGVVYVE